MKKYIAGKGGLFKRRIECLGHTIALGNSDIVFSTYPKSGTNWVLFLVANALAISVDSQEEINFHNKGDWISTESPRKPPVPRLPKIMHTHKLDYGFRCKVLYLVRHPADVMESYYEYKKQRWNEDVGSFSEFIRNPKNGIPYWLNHITSWEKKVGCLVRYEDLILDTKRELDVIMSFLGKRMPSDVLNSAVRKSSYESMLNMEKTYGLPVKPRANPDFTFMRKGEAKKGGAYFDKRDSDYLKRTAGPVMKKLGYD